MVQLKLCFPNKARLRNCTYTSHFTLDLNIKYIIRTGDTLENEEIRNVVLPKIHFGKIPIMLKSCLCVLNQYPHLSPEQTEECKMDPWRIFYHQWFRENMFGSGETCRQ